MGRHHVYFSLSLDLDCAANQSALRILRRSVVLRSAYVRLKTVQMKDRSAPEILQRTTEW